MLNFFIYMYRVFYNPFGFYIIIITLKQTLLFYNDIKIVSRTSPPPFTLVPHYLHTSTKSSFYIYLILYRHRLVRLQMQTFILSGTFWQARNLNIILGGSGPHFLLLFHIIGIYIVNTLITPYLSDLLGREWASWTPGDLRNFGSLYFLYNNIPNPT